MKGNIVDEWDHYSRGDVLDLQRRSPADLIDELKMEYIYPYLPSKGVIIEVGAGSGRLLTRVGLEHREDYQVIGIDFAPTATKVIKANLLKFDLSGASIRGDAYNLPLKDNSVDMVSSGGLLEHFREDEANSVIGEMVRILKKDGIFYADIVPGKRSLCRIRIKKEVGGYENSFKKEELRKVFEKNGLIDIKIFSGLILPPNFYGYKSESLKLQLMYKLKPFIKSLDDTLLSDWLGFAYYVFAKKR